MTKTEKIGKCGNGSPNSLDGFTILRFAHAYESGGGVEQHLEDLDRMLLNRNKLNILRMYLSKTSKGLKNELKKSAKEH